MGGFWHNPQESGAAGIPCEAFGSETKEMWKLKKKKKKNFKLKNQSS